LKKILLIAGYNNSWASLLVAEKLKLAGLKPNLILIAYPFSLIRIKAIIRNRGISEIFNYLFKKKDSNKKDILTKKSLNEMGIFSSSLKSWAKKNKVRIAQTSSINSNKSIEKIKKYNPDISVYTGGGIIGKELIEAANFKILNAHSGHMPDIRGMSAMEWSLLLNQPTGVTIHFIDSGIDTGKIVSWNELKPNKNDSINSLRQRIVEHGCNMLVHETNNFILGKIKNHKNTKNLVLSRQCFIIADALMEIAKQKLKK